MISFDIVTPETTSYNDGSISSTTANYNNIGDEDANNNSNNNSRNNSNQHKNHQNNHHNNHHHNNNHYTLSKKQIYLTPVSMKSITILISFASIHAQPSKMLQR